MFCLLILLISVITECGNANAQECTATVPDDTVFIGRIGYHLDWVEEPKILTVVKLLSFREAYEKECNKDTVKAIMYEGEYIINRGAYREMVTERQLEERGYKYKYRWVIKTDPIECEYIFLMEPTFQGFTKYLRKLIEN